jgi:hypothetical protein
MKQYSTQAILFLTFLTVIGIAPSFAVIEDKKVEATFGVSGVCGMCEERIESALDVKGIVMADWDIDTKKLHVVFNPSKISEGDIHALLNAVGHDTEKSQATQEQYEGLHGCCKYREGGAGSKCSASQKN